MSGGPESSAAGGQGQEPYAQVAETLSAVVFFAGDRVYKLKKPVNLGFLDFSAPQARAAACAREFELNRRYAPDVYLGVAEVRGPDGEVCDHLVVMRRMPASRRLSALLRARAPVTAAVRQVARILAAAHASAPRSPQISEQGSRDALRRRWAGNIEQVRLAPGRLLDPAAIAETERLAWQFLAGRGPLFDARISGGHILAGHGDLLADDIYCLDDGPRILDCLEFDDRLRWLDGLDDAAFLAMDLERLGHPELARRFTGWYAGYSGDRAPASLCHHYIAYRALVRAKVACLRCGQGDLAAAGQARQLAGLALGHLRAGAITLVLVGGLPGTGKSSLAGAVADRLGYTVLSSDRIRKELSRLPPRQRPAVPYGTGIYAPAVTESTYAELLRRAAGLLARGESAIADASWISAEHRAAAAATARGADARLVQLRCTAPAHLAAARMQQRTEGTSDASRQIAEQMAAVMAPWPEAITINTQRGGSGPAGPPGDLVCQALDAIHPPGPHYPWHPVRPYMLPG